MGIQSIGNNKTDVDSIIASLMVGDKFIVSDNIGKTGKVLYRLIGPTFDIAKNLMTISEVAASSTAMNAIAASSTAMNAIAASSTAMNAIIASSTALNAVVSSSTAMNAIAASSTAMNAIISSSTAMNAIIKSSTASAAINTAIQSYRSALLSALADTSKFTKTTTNVGNGSGTFTHGLNTNTIYIPVSCNDDNDTDYEVYSGVDNDNIVASIGRHHGEVAVPSGVCLRGTTVIGIGKSIGYVTFEIYTAI